MNRTDLSESEKAKRLKAQIEEYMTLTEPILKALCNLRNSIIPKMIFTPSSGHLEMIYPSEYLEAQAKCRNMMDEIHGIVFGENSTKDLL